MIFFKNGLQIWIQRIKFDYNRYPSQFFWFFENFEKVKKRGSKNEKKNFFQCKSILIHFFFLPWKFQLDRTIISRGWNFHFWFFENDPPEPPSGTPHERFLKISFLPKSSKLWFRKSQELSGGVYLNFFWIKLWKILAKKKFSKIFHGGFERGVLEGHFQKIKNENFSP